MAENEFEKRVKDKMDQFNLAPAPAVWNVVELRIRKEKKRRYLFFIFCLLLSSGAVTAWFFSVNKNKNVTSQIKVPATNSFQSANNKTTSKEIKTVPANNEHLTNVHDNELDQDSQAVATRAEKKETSVIPAGNNNKNVFPDKHLFVKTKPAYNSTPPQNIFIQPDTDLRPEETAVKEKAVAEVRSQQNSTDSAAVVGSKMVVDEMRINSDSLLIPNKNKNSKKMEWVIAVSAGRSAIVNNFRLFNAGVYRDVITFQAIPQSAAPTRRIGYLNPSVSYSASILFKKQLSGKLELHSGLNYQFFSTRMHAGMRIDSMIMINNSFSSGLAVFGYYRPSTTADVADYRNKYHFLGLSGELGWTIVEKQKFKMKWNNAFELNRLIASNMLHYDHSAKVYYRDNGRLNKNQLFFKTSFEIPVIKNISVNPFASFGLTSVFKQNDTAYRYTNFGLQLRIHLNKK